VRSQQEIEKVHDLIHLIVCAERAQLETAQRKCLNIIGKTLCWVLEHADGWKLEEILAQLDHAARLTGIGGGR
jgi:hypothetical protein